MGHCLGLRLPTVPRSSTSVSLLHTTYFARCCILACHFATLKRTSFNWMVRFAHNAQGCAWNAFFYNPDDYAHFEDMTEEKLRVLEPHNARYGGRPRAKALM